MQKKLDFAVKLSLEEMALRRSIINLWCEADVLSAIDDQNFKSLSADLFPSDCGETLNGMVKEKISSLVLAESLKLRMMDVYKPIGSDLLRWKIFHENIFHFSSYGLGIGIMKQLCWTSTGIVDYQRTAEKILGLDALGVQTRYKLASLYCLIDYIPALWKQLPRSRKKNYLSEKTWMFKRDLNWSLIEMDFYWAHILAEGESKVDDIAAECLPQNVIFHQFALEWSAISANKAAVEYFFHKLTKEERNVFLVPLVDTVARGRDPNPFRWPGYLPCERLSEVLCYLLSQMSPEQQLEVLKEKPYEVLSSLLDWPSQDVFLEIADVLWDFLPEKGYFCLVRTMALSISKYRYYLPTFIREFFLRSPKEYKKHFVNVLIESDFLLTLFFNAEDTMSLKVIFRNVDGFHKCRIIWSKSFRELANRCVMNDRVRMVKLCLEEAMLSEKLKSATKSLYMLCIRNFEKKDKQLKQQKWLQIFREIGKTNVSSSQKRSNNKAVRKVKKVLTRKK